MKNILFNVEMTKAILNGRKTNTRRAIKIPSYLINYDGFEADEKSGDISAYFYHKKEDYYIEIKPKYQEEEIIWVREPAKVIYFQDAGNYGGSWIEDTVHVQYLADEEIVYGWDEFPENAKSWLWECKGIPNGCCKSLARIFLEITNVRVELLQDITFEDIFKEGFDGEIKDYFISTRYKDKAVSANTPKEKELLNWWINLWNKTAPKGYKWEDNPYVFCCTFEVVKNEF